jgi:uncharacterized protein YeaO (DUF488 family)
VKRIPNIIHFVSGSTAQESRLNNDGISGMIYLKRAYERALPGDGHRVLVDRLWPRGIKKTDLALDGWVKEIAPSDRLRRWFAHDTSKWDEFRRRYFAELDRRPEVWREIGDTARNRSVTLVYSAHDTEYNNAVALKEYLQAHMGGKKKTSHA